MTSALNLPPLREVIARHKLAADKSFGQHFLLDMNVTDKIARAAGPLEGVHVLEIGPGPGGLTRSLLNAGAQKVSVIEMDGRFVPALMDIREASDNRLHIEMGDGVKIDPVSLGNVTRIAANLPYNVGTKMLINWLTAKPIFWNRLVLMFQKEVAERVTAAPGDKAYGRLAVLAQTVARAHMLMDVPAKCFSPPPKVDSAVIVLEPLDVDQRFEDLETLGQITAACFGMRRKMLRRSLKPFAAKHNIELETWLTDSQISPQQRPETVTPKQFQTLATTLVQNS